MIKTLLALLALLLFIAPRAAAQTDAGAPAGPDVAVSKPRATPAPAMPRPTPLNNNGALPPMSRPRPINTRKATPPAPAGTPPPAEAEAIKPAPGAVASTPASAPAAPTAPLETVAAPALAPAPASPTPAPPAALAASSADSLDFDLLGPEAQVSPEELARREQIQRALLLRRKMLTIHQVTGFVLLASITTTVVLGQLNYHDKYGGGGDSGKYITAHEVSAFTTTAIFAGGGLLALFAPSPIDSPTRLSTSTLHKTAMAVATAGMLAEVVLGVMSAHNEGQLSQRNYALAHQINGYVTLGAVATGFAVLTF